MSPCRRTELGLVGNVVFRPQWPLTFDLLQAQLGALMSILKEHISHMEREQLSVHQSELTSFFLSALAFRAEHKQVSPALS